MRTLDHFDFRVTTRRPVTKSDIDAAQAPSVWYLGNRTLYDLCQDHPSHKTTEEIIAEVWLIGRSYALHRASSIDPVADWIDLLIQHVVVTGVLFAAACAANIWLAFSIPVGANAKRRPAVVDADAPLPVW